MKSLRRRIDAIDSKIVELLGLRAQAVLEVGAWKRARGVPIRDPVREAAVLDRVSARSRGPLPPEVVRSIYATLVRECREFEDRATHHGTEGVRSARGLGGVRTVSIVGLGLMGASFALALRSSGARVKISGYDKRAPASLKKRGVVDELCASVENALQADVVILALPVERIRALIREKARSFRPGSVVLDLGSTKRGICRLAWSSLPAGVSFIGGHPLAGKSAAGAENAEAGLFSGRPFVLVAGGMDWKLGERVAVALVRAVGATPVMLDAEAHDRMLAATSHLPQMLSVALALSAEKMTRGKTVLSGPAFRDLTRLALSDYQMWKEIAEANSDFIDEALGCYIRTLASLRKSIRRGNFKREFSRAKRFRKATVPC